MKKLDKTIIIAINTSWNIYNFRLGLLEALQKQGYKIIILAPLDVYSYKLEDLGFEYHNININNKGTNPIEDMRLIWDFYKLYKEIKPDILLHYTIKPNIYGTIAAYFAEVPVISNISGLGTVFLSKNISSKIAKILYKLSLKIPKKVFFQNNADKDLFIRLKLVNKTKVEVLPGSGINTKKCSPALFPANNKQKTFFSFLFVARLIKDKGLIEYVSAARILKKIYPKIRFFVLGAFYPRNPTAIIKEEIEVWEKEGTINYLGVSDEVLSIMASSDCIVLPSYREGLSRVLLEASSMEKPIITTDVPGCRDVIEDGLTGYLCKLKDVDDLVFQMKKIIELDPRKRIEMGKKGRKKVIKEYDESLVIKSYKIAIESILKYN